MHDSAGEYYVLNGLDGKFRGAEDFEDIGGERVYEVVRVIGGVPLFLQDHYERLGGSVAALGKRPETGLGDLSSAISRLGAANGIADFNAKVVVFNAGDGEKCLVYACKSYYPTAAEVSEGVRAGLLEWSRSSPNLKLVAEGYREAVSRAITDKEVFEVILVNSDGVLTEGSKSNLFFASEGKIITAPGDLVLKGVTRKYVIQACESLGLPVVERPVKAGFLREAEGLFITGTSIKVLPVAGVEHLRFSSSTHPAITAVRDRYDEILGEYIERHSG